MQERVGPYRPIYVKCLSNVLRLHPELNNKKPMYELGVWFVRDILQCNLQSDSLKDLFDSASSKYQSQAMPLDLSPAERFLFSRLGSADYGAYMELQKVQASKSLSDSTTKEADKTLCGPSTSSSLLTLSRDYQAMYSTARALPDKLDVMCSAVFELRALLKAGKKMKVGGQTCKGNRQLYQYYKIVACMYDCFGGDKEKFLETHPKLILKKFTCVNSHKHSLK